MFEIGASVYSACKSVGGNVFNSMLYTTLLITGCMILIILVMCPMKTVPIIQITKMAFYMFCVVGGIIVMFRGVGDHVAEVEAKKAQAHDMLGRAVGDIPQVVHNDNLARSAPSLSDESTSGGNASAPVVTETTPMSTSEILASMLAS